VTLHIFNILGQLVKTLVNNEIKEKGVYALTWDGRNNAGVEAASGIYMIRMKAGEFITTRKMLLIK